MAKRHIACLILISLLICSTMAFAQAPPPPPPPPPGMPMPPPPPAEGIPPYDGAPPDDTSYEEPEIYPDEGTGHPEAGYPEAGMPEDDERMPAPHPGQMPSDGETGAPGHPQPPIRPVDETGPPSEETREDRQQTPQRQRLPQPPPSAFTPRDAQAVPVEEMPEIIAGVGRNWPMFKGDAAHTGYTDENLDLPLKLAWRHSTEMAPNNPSSPAVADGVIYFCSGRRLYAVNAETGTLRWRFPSEDSLTAVIRSSPLVGENLVYFGAGDGRLYAVTKDTGEPVWSFSTRGIMNSSPILADGVIYVGSSDNSLYSLDAETGQMIWPGGFVTRDDVSSSPAVSDGLVYFLSNDMVLYAAHTTTGRRRWETRIGTWARNSSPVVADNTVYVAAGNTLQAYQAKSGRRKWGLNFASELTTVPAVARGVIFIAARNGNLYAITDAGRLKWSAEVGSSAYGSPIVAGDTVFVGANRGIVAAYDVETGDLQWKYHIEPASFDHGRLRYVNITSTPVVANGVLYVLADDGTLHAFRSDIPDTTPPQVTTVVPPRDHLIHGAPPIELAAMVSDTGSGINEESISMQFNGEAVDFTFYPERGLVYYRIPASQPLRPLQDGLHEVSLSIADWAGNVQNMSWYFRVDNRIPRQRRTQEDHRF